MFNPNSTQRNMDFWGPEAHPGLCWIAKGQSQPHLLLWHHLPGRPMTLLKNMTAILLFWTRNYWKEWTELTTPCSHRRKIILEQNAAWCCNAPIAQGPNDSNPHPFWSNYNAIKAQSPHPSMLVSLSLHHAPHLSWRVNKNFILYTFSSLWILSHSASLTTLTDRWWETNTVSILKEHLGIILPP